MSVEMLKMGAAILTLIAFMLIMIFMLAAELQIDEDGEKSNTKSREKAINKVYKCTNDSCSRDLVRLYEIFELLKYGVPTGNGREVILITSEKELDIVKKQDKFDYHKELRIFNECKTYCPECKKLELKEIENFDWMDNMFYPEYISEEKWLDNIEAFKVDYDKEMSNLDDIETEVKAMRELSSFQEHYDLNVDNLEVDIVSIKAEIVKQLRLISRLSSYYSARLRANNMLEKLEM